MDRRTLLETAMGAAATLSYGLSHAQASGANSRGPSLSGDIAPSIDFTIDRRKTAFINVDMQNCFVEGYPVSAPDGPVLLPRLNAFAAVCRNGGIRVIHTAHVLRADGSNAGFLGKYIPPIHAGMINRGSHAAALHKDLVVDSRDIILEKPRFGAFHGTDLELMLRANNIESVIIGGIATNVCCETTAREAAARDFHVLFLSDGTATMNLGNLTAAQLQEATCTTLRLFGQVLPMKVAIAKIGQA